MKKEIENKIMDMLILDGKNKTFNINDVFYLESEQIDKYGVSVEVSNNEPVDLNLYVKCKKINGVEYNFCSKIYSRELDDIISSIISTIETIMECVADEMVAVFTDDPIDWSRFVI